MYVPSVCGADRLCSGRSPLPVWHSGGQQFDPAWLLATDQAEAEQTGAEQRHPEPRLID